MRKSIFISVFLTAILFTFTSCASEPDPDSESKNSQLKLLTLIQKLKDENSVRETTENFNEIDTSKYSFTFPTRNDLTMETGFIKITQKDGKKSNSVSNWVLSQNFIRLEATGFEAAIKLNSSMNFAGLQLFKTGSYDCFQFQIQSDGKFIVKDSSKTVVNLTTEESYINPASFNKIQVKTMDSGNVEIFVNGVKVAKLESDKMSFSLSNSDKIAVCYNAKSTATASTPAEAWIKLLSLQVKK